MPPGCRRRQVDRLPVLALEGGGALLDARRLDEAARRGGQIADRKLVDAVRHGRRRHVHVEAQIPGGERADELAGLLDVEQRVLAPGGAEHHVVRLLADRVEEAVGRDIADAVLADGRYPADRARHHQRLEGIVLQAVLVLARLVEHCAFSLWLPMRQPVQRVTILASCGPIAIGLLLLGGADVDEAGDALVGGEPERRAHGGAVGIPLRDPAGAEAQRVGGQAQIEAGGAAGQDLLPLGRAGIGRHARDRPRPRSARAAAACARSRAGRPTASPSPRRGRPCSRTRPKVARASPSNTMKRQGSSFLWSGTRAAAVRMVSSCCGRGPGLGQHCRL